MGLRPGHTLPIIKLLASSMEETSSFLDHLDRGGRQIYSCSGFYAVINPPLLCFDKLSTGLPGGDIVASFWWFQLILTSGYVVSLYGCELYL